MNIIEFAEDFGIFFSPVKATWVTDNKLQQYEKDFLSDLVEHRFTLALASRQMNMTTLLATYAAYRLICVRYYQQ